MTVYLPLFTVCIRPRGFGFMLPVKPRNVNQSLFKQTGGITVTRASLFRLLATSLGQESFATWTLACTEKNKHRTENFFAGGGVLHDHKTQTHFSRLIGACLTCALRCYLQTSTFIPTQPDTSKVPPLPPPADFAPVPSYPASIRRHRLGTGLY